MIGETVTIEYKTRTGFDEFNAAVYETSQESVSNVIVAPATASEITDSNRPDGVRVKYTLHFPKTFSGSLKGCRVNVRGNWHRVIGDPQHYTAENTPGEWWLPADVEDIDG